MQIMSPTIVIIYFLQKLIGKNILTILMGQSFTLKINVVAN